MKYRIAVLSASLLTLPLSGCVTTGSDGVKSFPKQVLAASGERTRIRQDWSIKNDCSQDGLPKVRVPAAPAHGQVSIVEEGVFPNSRRLPKCRTKKVAGIATYYTSDPGYLGSDHLRLRQSYSGGDVTDTDVHIKVVR